MMESILGDEFNSVDINEYKRINKVVKNYIDLSTVFKQLNKWKHW